MCTSTACISSNAFVYSLCPHSKKGLTLKQAVQNKTFFLTKVDSSAALKTSHRYHHQVQGNVYCCNLNWADFVVYFGRDNLFCERIKVDSEWQKKNIPKLDHFHKTAILPELFTQRAKGGKKLYGMYEERLIVDAECPDHCISRIQWTTMYSTGKWTPYGLPVLGLSRTMSHLLQKLCHTKTVRDVESSHFNTMYI